MINKGNELHPEARGSEQLLHNRTAEELGKLFPVTIHDYTKKWNCLYQEEKKAITGSFASSEIVCVDHIGSTAVPGLKAKPVIDILLQIAEHADIQNVKRVFAALGYLLTEQPNNPPPHMTFVKGYTIEGIKGQVYHVHVRYPGDWDEIRFRDYLIVNKEVAKEYEALKIKLAEKYRNNREAYTQSKTGWIQTVNKLTRK